MRRILNFFKYIVERLLRGLVRLKLSRTNPTIIGVTGSFGKTTTKEAVYEVLKTKWRVYRNPKSLNTEIGLLLAVLEQPSGFRNPIKWLSILARTFINSLFGKKYDFVILEYGADKPGDIQHLVKIVRPDIAIITKISPVHTAAGQFENEEAVFEEKLILAKCLPAEGMAILNGEDKWLQKLKGKVKAKCFWFGSVIPRHSALNLIQGISESEEMLKRVQHDIGADQLKNTADGFSTKIHLGNQNVDAKFPVLGSFHINAFLPAFLIGTLNGITLQESVKALEDFKLPPGRMSKISGKNGALILDSTYNAAPEALAQALFLLKDIPAKRKIAVIGNMNELGEFTEEAHRKVAKNIDSWLGELVTVGEFAALIADECLKNGFPRHKIKILHSAEAASRFLLEEYGIKKGDIILLKGSQNRMRLERAVKLLMAHPEDAKKLLCRQETEWQEIE